MEVWVELCRTRALLTLTWVELCRTRAAIRQFAKPDPVLLHRVVSTVVVSTRVRGVVWASYKPLGTRWHRCGQLYSHVVEIALWVGKYYPPTNAFI